MSMWRADSRYTRLVVEHGDELMRLAVMLTGSWYDGQDVTQDVLISVSKIWPIAKPLPYLKRAIANRAIDVMRKRREVLVDIPQEVPYEDSGFLRYEQHRAFFELLRNLPERQRQVVVLRYFEDLDDRTVAEMLGITVQTVRSQVHHALTALRTSAPVRTVKEDS